MRQRGKKKRKKKKNPKHRELASPAPGGLVNRRSKRQQEQKAASVKGHDLPREGRMKRGCVQVDPFRPPHCQTAPPINTLWPAAFTRSMKPGCQKRILERRSRVRKCTKSLINRVKGDRFSFIVPFLFLLIKLFFFFEQNSYTQSRVAFHRAAHRSSPAPRLHLN